MLGLTMCTWRLGDASEREGWAASAAAPPYLHVRVICHGVSTLTGARGKANTRQPDAQQVFRHREPAGRLRHDDAGGSQHCFQLQ